jgi:hypothetical protein
MNAKSIFMSFRAFSLLAALCVNSEAFANPTEMAIIVQDSTALRAAPRDSAQQQAVLWQGELVEIRGQRMDYLQVYDYHRERGGFVRANQIRRTALTATEAADLLSVLLFVRDSPGAEALGFGYAAAYLKAAPAEELRSATGSEVFDALGSMAERLAQHASAETSVSKNAALILSSHLEVAARYGIKFISYERDGRMLMCYDGEAYHYVLAGVSTPIQRAQAALALTRAECIDPDLGPRDRYQLNEQYSAILDKVGYKDLPDYLKNRVFMRRASVWSRLAYHQIRNGENAIATMNRALTELAGVNTQELPDADLSAFNNALMLVSANRWAALPAGINSSKSLNIVTTSGQPGETCVALVDGTQELLKRCTYSSVWNNSISINREQNALALAVQPTEAWREIWLFRKTAQGWVLLVLPPNASNPELGYIEFAGWIPGGKQMLIAREARSEGKYKRSFEVLNLDTATVQQQSSKPELLGALQRWQAVRWKEHTLSVR